MTTESFASSSKCRKVSANASTVDDRLSSLPESIISQILSLLPTKYAVATSGLSTTWRFRWTSISNLDFDDSLPPLYPEKSSTNKTTNLSFQHFVNRVLLLLNPQCISKFRLVCEKALVVRDGFQVEQWIAAVLKGNIQEFDLDITHWPRVEIPRTLFTCTTLVMLYLAGDSLVLSVPATCVWFPNLETLHLDVIRYKFNKSSPKRSEYADFVPNIKILYSSANAYESEGWQSTLFFSCPALQDLNISITSPSLIPVPSFEIHAPALQSFSYVEDTSLPYSNQSYCKLQIIAPRLELMNLVTEHKAEEFMVETLPSLDMADIAFMYEEDEPSTHCQSVAHLLKAVCNVKFMTLSSNTLKAAALASEFVAPVFSRLHYLDLEFSAGTWKLLTTLLENSPNLEELVCDEVFKDGVSRWKEPDHVPKCLLSCLKSVRIIGLGRSSDPHTNELRLVNYILQNAKVLETMTIRASITNIEESFKVIQKIAKFPRGSPTCQLDFS